jgi:hypothetical protein
VNMAVSCYLNLGTSNVLRLCVKTVEIVIKVMLNMGAGKLSRWVHKPATKQGGLENQNLPRTEGTI